MKLGYFYHKEDHHQFSGVLRDHSVVEFDSQIPGKIIAEHDPALLEILPPVKPQKIIGVGLNYRAHATEMDMKIPPEPVIFFKPPTAIIPHMADIIGPQGIDRVDFEGELALVVKRKAKNIPESEAQDYILGYMALNDVTAREKQAQDGQWARSKGYDTFAPCGPFIETDVPEPMSLGLQTLVNDKLVQDGNTSDMIYNVNQLFSFISSVMTLEPGDVISTGTPPGIGPLQNGDVVTVRIEGLSDLQNTFRRY